MAQRYWKLEKSGELGAVEVAALVGGGGHIVLRLILTFASEIDSGPAFCNVGSL